MATRTTLREARPDVAAQLLDPTLADRLTPGSNKSVEWVCPDHGHTWSAKISNRVNARNLHCPYCTNRRVLPGFNDLATTHPDLAAQLQDPLKATTVTAGSGAKLTWRCPTHPDHHWQATPNNRTSSTSRSSGCPVCANKTVVPGLNDLATTHPDLAAQLQDPTLATTVTAGHNGHLRWICHAHTRPFTWDTSPVLRTRQSTGCPVCSERIVVAGLNDLATTHPDLTAQIADPQPDETSRADVAVRISRGSHALLTWTCADNPDHHWQATVKDRVRGTGCPDCANVGTSRKETELLDVIRALVPEHRVEHHALINGRTGRPGGSPTVDILVPDHNLAIEFNGLYWHSELHCSDRRYHARKTDLAHQAGLQLLHIWEDDWNARRSLIIRSIAHRLHARHRLLKVLSTGTVLPADTDPRVAETVYARQLTPTRVRGITAATFLDDNHLQGAVTATWHLALTEPDSGDIRALLSIRSPRNNARTRRGAGVWEIQRYATLGHVPGGFSRLLTHAEKALRAEGIELTQWVTFANRDISEGGLYETTGFTRDKNLPPDYHYVGAFTGWRRTPKESFQRRRFREDDRLVWDESWTEHQAALANKLYRVYDSGKTRWVKHI